MRRRIVKRTSLSVTCTTIFFLYRVLGNYVFEISIIKVSKLSEWPDIFIFLFDGGQVGHPLGMKYSKIIFTAIILFNSVFTSGSKVGYIFIAYARLV